MAMGEGEGEVTSNADELATESESDYGHRPSIEVCMHTAATPTSTNHGKFNQYEYYTDLYNQILGNLHMLALLDRGEQVMEGKGRSPVPLVIVLGL